MNRRDPQHDQSLAVRADGALLYRRIRPHDLMPPEPRYRPRPRAGTNIASTFFFVFVTAMAMLWFTTSLWPLFLIVLIFFGQAFYQRSSHLTAVQQNQHGVNLLNAGRVDEAAEIFERLTETERNTAAHSVFVFNRAVAYMLQGRLRRAFSLFNAVRKSRHFSRGGARAYEPLMYIEMGTCLALMGMLDEAQEYRERAARTLDTSEEGRLAFLDALLAVRRGHDEQAIRELRRTWRAAEGLLRVPTLKALRLLHAFALGRVGGHKSPSFRSLLEGVRPFHPGEFDWVGVEWPEFRAFLARHGFR